MASINYKVIAPTYDEQVAAVIQGFTNAGWTLHDDIGTYEKVFSSKGETDTEITGYVHIYRSTSQIYMKTYLYWNNSTHVGTCDAYNTPSSRVSCAETADTYIHVVGSKDGLYAKYGQLANEASFSGYNYSRYAGFLKPSARISQQITTAITAGSNTSFDVPDGSVYKSGGKYQLIGSNYEGREMVIIDSISGNTITLQNSNSNYAIGSYFGLELQWFGHDYYTSGYRCFFVADHSQSGTATGSYTNYGGTKEHTSISYLDPDTYSDHYYMTQRYISFASSLSCYPYNSIGAYYGPRTVANSLACISSANRDEICQCYSATINTIEDTSKTWTTDEFVGRFCVISFGTGESSTRKIVSNTSTTLTLEHDWHVIPDATSLFYIVDSVYRNTSIYSLNPVFEDPY